MKIAIVAPASVPYVVGGAENLYRSLCRYFNEETSHSCEIVTLPSPEENFSEIIDSYCRFSELDLDHFDLVISTKYPSWMISHRNHVCYMLHPLRGLYDTYHLMGLPYDVDWDQKGLNDIKKMMDAMAKSSSVDNSALGPFFRELKRISTDKKNTSLLAFPGPFVREIVHFLDAYALSANRIKNHFAISSTVVKREGYFPSGINALPLYPAPLIDGFECKEFKFIFTTSRLDGPKRIDLIIEAFKLVSGDIQLIIAGDGLQRDYLERLAKKDNRIRFVGRVDDNQLREYYANALAVVFVPYDEDYGYVTIEAMKSSKPVITTTDSGGPNEFVKDGINGFSVPPSPKDIAEKIELLFHNVEMARQLGAKAAETVENIEWRYVADQLLVKNNIRSDALNSSKTRTKKKMVVAVTFPVYPPRGGGQARVFNLYRNLTQHYDIEIVCLCHQDLPALSREISPGLIETRIPFPDKFIEYEQKLSKKVDWVPITDIALIDGYKMLHDYNLVLKAALESADIAVSCHPYLARAIRDFGSDIDLWFEAQDVELDLKTQLLPENSTTDKLLKMVFDAEKDCWLHADLVFACTERDLDRLSELYGSSQATKIEVPNGVDFDSAVFLGNTEKKLLKRKLGIENKNTVLFMGSWHGPNLEAAEQLIQIAPSFPDVYFFLVGSAGLAFGDRELPSNIVIFGEVDDEEKQIVMCASDVAINPMLSGSGSNLKMLDFFAYGLPVISTPFGARGIDAEPSIHFVNSDINSLPLELSSFFALKQRYGNMQMACRDLVNKKYSWKTIADSFFTTLSSKLNGR